MLTSLLLNMLLCVTSLNAVIYDCYTGKPVTEKRMALYIQRNNTQYCVIDVDPCDEYEWRRVDGSCNNLRYPSMGMVRTPTIKILPTVFSPNYEPRKSEYGEPLPPARYLRTETLLVGKTSEIEVTQLVSYYMLFGVHDVNSVHDIINYLGNTTNCCEPSGKSNYICAPNMIPIDDPVHQYSGVSCHNNTRPQSFQYFGCADFDTTEFSRITFSTPLFDLSQLYGSDMFTINNLRRFVKGLLKIEIDNGKVFPPRHPSTDRLINTCILNELPRETRCHRYQINPSIGANLLIILFYRHHNYIAKILAEINPCWDDHRLFYTARDINIAIHVQIYLYEVFPIIFGKKNLLEDGVISHSGGFRDMYNEDIEPQMTDEFVYMKRWYHIIQEMDMKLYDKDGFFLRTFPMANLTARTGNLPLDDNLERYFQGSFRQYSGGFAQTVEYDMAEKSFGNAQYVFDATMSDLSKGRYLGFAPYVRYREICSGRSYNSFNSLKDVMTEERIYRLQQVYKNVEDVELLAGTWAENRIPGGLVPYTVYCLMVQQLKRSMVSDRHWYERPNRPHAFTMKQLQAIRKSTIAGLMCTTADGVTEIQPNAFYRIASDNPVTSCSSPEIGKIDLSPWKDIRCIKGSRAYNEYHNHFY